MTCTWKSIIRKQINIHFNQPKQLKGNHSAITNEGYRNDMVTKDNYNRLNVFAGLGNENN